jgi:hypothetical protein
MTNDEIQKTLYAYSLRIERAEREGWTMLPIPLEQRAFDLRMQQLKERIHAKAS